MYPTLDKVYKGQFPFRLGTTSYIYPDGYTANVNALGPFVDEIELLIFESQPVSRLPSVHEIRELADVAADHKLSFNVHLPLDIFPGDPDARIRQRAVETVKRIMELTEALNATTSTLHLPYASSTHDSDAIRAWQGRLDESLAHILDSGIDPKSISVETLNYPIDWIEDIIAAYGLSVCLDVGHVIKYGFDLEDVYHHFLERIAIIHLHGVSQGRDHLPLDRISKNECKKIISLLQNFTESVSLEVFAYDHLVRSVAFLEKIMEPYYG
jgi:sugar phosphate isomerase/epimerase